MAKKSATVICFNCDGKIYQNSGMWYHVLTSQGQCWERNEVPADKKWSYASPDMERSKACLYTRSDGHTRCIQNKAEGEVYCRFHVTFDRKQQEEQAMMDEARAIARWEREEREKLAKVQKQSRMDSLEEHYGPRLWSIISETVPDYVLNRLTDDHYQNVRQVDATNVYISVSRLRQILDSQTAE